MYIIEILTISAVLLIAHFTPKGSQYRLVNQILASEFLITIGSTMLPWNSYTPADPSGFAVMSLIYFVFFFLFYISGGFVLARISLFCTAYHMGCLISDSVFFASDAVFMSVMGCVALAQLMVGVGNIRHGAINLTAADLRRHNDTGHRAV